MLDTIFVFVLGIYIGQEYTTIPNFKRTIIYLKNNYNNKNNINHSDKYNFINKLYKWCENLKKN